MSIVSRLIMAGVAPTTTWNPADKDANVALSGGDLTAAASTGDTFHGVRSISGKSTGKYYWEVTCNASPGTFGVIGWANSLFGLTVDTPTPYHNGVARPAFAPGDNVGIALDLNNNKFWYRINGGDWNETPGDDPATNTGGTTTAADGTAISAVARPIYAMFSAQAATVVANFGATPFAYVRPSGFRKLG